MYANSCTLASSFQRSVLHGLIYSLIPLPLGLRGKPCPLNSCPLRTPESFSCPIHLPERRIERERERQRDTERESKREKQRKRKGIGSERERGSSWPAQGD